MDRSLASAEERRLPTTRDIRLAWLADDPDVLALYAHDLRDALTASGEVLNAALDRLHEDDVTMDRQREANNQIREELRRRHPRAAA